MNRTQIAIAGAGLLVLASAPVLTTMGSAEAGAPSGTLTLVQMDKESQFHFVDAAPQGKDGAGDVYALSAVVRDEDGQKAGRVTGSWVATTARQGEGVVTVRLHDGTLELVGGYTSLAIAGGTGAYVGAEGSMEVKGTKNGDLLVFTFAD